MLNLVRSVCLPLPLLVLCATTVGAVPPTASVTCVLAPLSVEMAASAAYTKYRVLSLHWQGYKVSTIVDCLVVEDGIKLTKQGVRRFL